MTWRVSKDNDVLHYAAWDVRHTVDGKWAVTTRSDQNYGNAFRMAEEVYDGKRWRPVSDIVQSSKPTLNGWEELTFTLPMSEGNEK